jgi:hypothetical protein
MGNARKQWLLPHIASIISMFLPTWVLQYIVAVHTLVWPLHEFNQAHQAQWRLPCFHGNTRYHPPANNNVSGIFSGKKETKTRAVLVVSQQKPEVKQMVSEMRRISFRCCRGPAAPYHLPGSPGRKGIHEPTAGSRSAALSTDKSLDELELEYYPERSDHNLTLLNPPTAARVYLDPAPSLATCSLFCEYLFDNVPEAVVRRTLRTALIRAISEQ